MDTAKLITEFGLNPYDFFWILTESNPNPNLNKENQNNCWKKLLVEMGWQQANEELSDVDLIMITDNGDYIFAAAEETIICNPRDSVIERFRMEPTQFLKKVRTIGSFVKVENHVGVVVAYPDQKNVLEDYLAVWYGQITEDNKPRVRTVPEEYCEPIDKIEYYH